jgi:hypothetical protein
MIPSADFVTEQAMGLLTDIYEVTMAQSSLRGGRNEGSLSTCSCETSPPGAAFSSAPAPKRRCSA